MINTFRLQRDTHFCCRAAPSLSFKAAVCISSALIKTYEGGTFTVVSSYSQRGSLNLHIFEFELEIS